MKGSGVVDESTDQAKRKHEKATEMHFNNQTRIALYFQALSHKPAVDKIINYLRHEAKDHTSLTFEGENETDPKCPSFSSNHQENLSVKVIVRCCFALLLRDHFDRSSQQLYPGDLA